MSAKSFQEIYRHAVERKGEDALAERFSDTLDAASLAAVSDDRYLAAMAQCCFAAGFRWRVVQAKWDGFEEAFEGFEPNVVAAFDDARTTALAKDKRIIRNPQKINATVENARFINAVAAEHGTFANWIANWPDDDPVGLWAELSKRGSRLGGNTGPRFMRLMGKDTFILTPDVAYALTEQGVLTGKPTSKKQQQAAQEAFVQWRNESGRPFAELSVILACTVDRPAEDD